MNCIRPDCGALPQPTGTPCSCDAFEARVQTNRRIQGWMFSIGAVLLICGLVYRVHEYGPF